MPIIVNPKAHDYDIKWPKLRSSVKYNYLKDNDDQLDESNDVLNDDPWPKLSQLLSKSGRKTIRKFEKQKMNSDDKIVDTYYHDCFIENDSGNQDSIYVMRRVRIDGKFQYEYHARVMLDKLIPSRDKYEITQVRIKANSLKPYYLITTLYYKQKCHFTSMVELPNAVLCIETVRSKASSYSQWIKFHHSLREEIHRQQRKKVDDDKMIQLKPITKLMTRKERKKLMQSWRDVFRMRCVAQAYETSEWLSYDLELNIDDIIDRQVIYRHSLMTVNKWWMNDNG